MGNSRVRRERKMEIERGDGRGRNEREEDSGGESRRERGERDGGREGEREREGDPREREREVLNLTVWVVYLELATVDLNFRKNCLYCDMT